MQYSILDFGAVADGETLCTEAINKTIRSVAEAGGGYAIVPAGRFLTGSIRILSNVHLVLEPGSVLLGTLDTNLIEPLTEKEGSRPLISAVGQMPSAVSFGRILRVYVPGGILEYDMGEFPLDVVQSLEKPSSIYSVSVCLLGI